MRFDFLDVRNLITTFDAEQPTGDAFLDGRYDWQTRKFGSPKPYYRLFYRISEVFRPRLVVELGAWRCTGAANWTPHAGRVVTIDHHGDPGDDENERWCVEAANNYPNLTYLKGWTWDVVDDVAAFGKIDVLFIDSWHIYEKAMKDWNAYRPLLSPEGALVIFDDIFYGDSPAISQTGQVFDEISEGFDSIIISGIATYPMGFFRWTG